MAADLCDQMNALVNEDNPTPAVALTLLVEQHGVWAVVRALIATVLRPQPEVIRLDDLSPHMRRDMGLPPIEGPRKYWELR